MGISATLPEKELFGYITPEAYHLAFQSVSYWKMAFPEYSDEELLMYLLACTFMPNEL
jgi:hypothetical protein